MRNTPKSVRFSSVLVFLLIFGCQASQKHIIDQEISKSDALSLAVSLANTECDMKYSVTPFDSASYAIEFRDGFWHWGNLDLRGFNGYSAVVSFDKKGNSRNVEVFFSTDVPRVNTDR